MRRILVDKERQRSQKEIREEQIAAGRLDVFREFLEAQSGA